VGNAKLLNITLIIVILVYVFIGINMLLNTEKMVDQLTSQDLEQALITGYYLELTDLQSDETILYTIKKLYGKIPYPKYFDGYYQFNKNTLQVNINTNGIPDQNCILIKDNTGK